MADYTDIRSRVGSALLYVLISVLLTSLLAACTPNEAPLLIATQTLIPPTETRIPSIIEPTETSQPRMDAAQVAASSPTVTPFAPLILPDYGTDEGQLSQAQALLEDLARRQGIPASLITWVQVSDAVWIDSSLGCRSMGIRLEQVFTGEIYTFLIGSELYSYHLTQDARVYCGRSAFAEDEVLLRVDPIASELVQLAQRRVAQQLDLPLRRVMLIAARPYLWQDTSLGCPQPGQVYTDVQIPGYRIVVGAGDMSFAFHSDSEQLFPCEAGQESLS